MDNECYSVSLDDDKTEGRLLIWPLVEVASRSSRTTSSNSFPEELQQRRGRDIGLTLEGRQSFRLVEEDDDDYWDYLN